MNPIHTCGKKRTSNKQILIQMLLNHKKLYKEKQAQKGNCDSNINKCPYEKERKNISPFIIKKTVCGIRDLNIHLFLLKQFLFRKKNRNMGINIKSETIRQKIIGYNDNISTSVKRRNIHLYFIMNWHAICSCHC